MHLQAQSIAATTSSQTIYDIIPKNAGTFLGMSDNSCCYVVNRHARADYLTIFTPLTTYTPAGRTVISSPMYWPSMV